MKAKQCCNKRNKQIPTKKRGEKVGRATANKLADISFGYNKKKMSKSKAQHIRRSDKGVANREPMRNVKNIKGQAATEIRSAVSAYNKEAGRQKGKMINRSKGFSKSVRDKTRTK